MQRRYEELDEKHSSKVLEYERELAEKITENRVLMKKNEEAIQKLKKTEDEKNDLETKNSYNEETIKSLRSTIETKNKDTHEKSMGTIKESI